MQNIKKISLITLFCVMSAVCFAQVFLGNQPILSTKPSYGTGNSRDISQQDFQNLVDKLGQSNAAALKKESLAEFQPASTAPIPKPSPIEKPGNMEQPMPPVGPVNNNYTSSSGGQTSTTTTTTTTGKPAEQLPATQFSNQPYTGFSGTPNNSPTASPTAPVVKQNQPSGFNIQY